MTGAEPGHVSKFGMTALRSAETMSAMVKKCRSSCQPICIAINPGNLLGTPRLYPRRKVQSSGKAG